MTKSLRYITRPMDPRTIEPMGIAVAGMEITYHNYSQRNVAVLDRNNIPQLIPGNSVSSPFGIPTLIVRTTYKFLTVKDCRDSHTFMTRIQAKLNIFNDEFRNLYASISEKMANNTHNHVTLSYDTLVNLDELASNGGVTYDQCTDKMFCLAEIWQGQPHPHSQEAAVGAEVQRFNTNRKASGVMIEVIDNDGTITDRFIYCAGRMVRVSPVSNPELTNGVYVTVMENDQTGDPKAKTMHMTYAEAAEQIGLHRTQEEAQAAGDPAKVLKMREAELENARLEQKRNEAEANKGAFDSKKALEAFKAELEARLAVRDAEERDRKLEDEKRLEKEKRKTQKEKKRSDKVMGKLEKVKMKAMKMKEKFALSASKRAHELDSVRDHYEYRSHIRKDTSETFKFVPALIAGALSIFAILRMAG